MRPRKHPGWIDVPDWWDHQSYKEKVPTYVKLETRFTLTASTRQLTLSERGLLVSLWTALAGSQFAITADLTDLRRILGAQVRPEALKRLADAGLIAIVPERPAIEKRRRASRARARERSRDTRGKEELRSSKKSSGAAALEQAAAAASQSSPAPAEHVPDREGQARVAAIMRTAVDKARAERGEAGDAGLLDLDLFRKVREQ